MLLHSLQYLKIDVPFAASVFIAMQAYGPPFPKRPAV